MKDDRVRSRLWAILLGFLASFGGIGVMVTAMRFNEISMFPIALGCLGACVLWALLTGTRGLPVALGVTALGCFWLWREETLELSCEAMLHQLSKLYDMGYHCGVIRWTEAPMEQENAVLILCILGALVALAVVWFVIRGKGVWLAVLMTIAPLIPCTILTDTVPEPFYLFLQFLSILLLLLQQMVRRRNIHQGNRLMGFLVIPVAVAMAVLFFAMPRESYNGQIYAQKMQDFFQELFRMEQPAETVPVYIPGFAEDTPNRVNLTTVGNKAALRIPVMEVSAEEDGVLYLRGTSYDTYRGTHWDEDAIDSRFPFYSSGAAPRKVTITTRNIHDLIYVPYAATLVKANGEIVKNNVMGRIKNENNLRAYTVTYSPPTYFEPLRKPQETSDRVIAVGPDGKLTVVDKAQVTTQAMVRYLQLDKSTREAAEALLARELPELADMEYDWDKAQAIVEYVRGSAVYDLQTDHMPQGYQDFAIWFLTESDTGYCTHFATALTVLLRAAGIPSRYVTGYITQTKAHENVTVYQKNAHAWTEIYIPDAGWVVLDATPSGGIDQTAGTEQEGTTGPTETTDPEESTSPDETTAPTETTAPVESGETTAPTEEPTMPDDTKPNVGGNNGKPGDGGDVTEEREPFVLPDWAKNLLWIIGAVTAVVGQWKLRVYLRKRRHTHGTTNARTLAMWRDVEKYAWLLGVEPEEKLLELAWKARFSQYRLTREEAKTMEFGMNALRRKLWNADGNGKWKRLYARLILALY